MDAIPSFKNGRDKPFQVFVTFKDITNQIFTERQLGKYREELEELVAERTAKLRENERVLSTSISNLHGMVYTCKNDKDRTMTFISDATESKAEFRTSIHIIRNYEQFYGKFVKISSIQLNPGFYKKGKHLMKKIMLCIAVLLVLIGNASAQDNLFEPFEFLLGEWTGNGSGFGNETSTIQSEFKMVMNGRYLQVTNESRFEPTDNNPDGELHIDLGMISYDKTREMFIFRQFNVEGFVNQYVLIDSVSSDSVLVFETESIENFVPGGRARWTIKNTGANTIETSFDLSFPGKEFACYGTNALSKK